MKLLSLRSFAEFQMELADMPEMALGDETTGAEVRASPVFARLRLTDDAFEFIQFVAREPSLASKYFYPGDPMPDWVKKLLDRALPADVGFTLIERNN